MSKKSRQRHRETAMVVFSGLLINYPAQLLLLWLFISVMEITDPVTLSVLISANLTVIAYIRVYIVRSYYDK
mgnify:FL=1